MAQPFRWVLIAVVMVLMLVIGAVMRHQEKSRS